MKHKQRQELHGTKYGLHPTLPIILIYIGSCVLSLVFGMELFPAFTDICARALLKALSNVGYASIALILIGIGLEAYHLYEYHKRHVMWIVIVALAMAAAAMNMLYFVTKNFSC